MERAPRCPDFAAILKDTAPDTELFQQVAECFYEELQRQARRRCRDQGLAEDAAQDTLVTVMESIGTYRGDAPLERWLSRIVVSSCSRLRRGKKNDPRLKTSLDTIDERTAGIGEASQETELFLRERTALLEAALADLPSDNRSLLLLHEGHSVSLADLAAQFGLTVDSVKARLKRTRARVRKRLIELAAGEEEAEL